MDPSGLFGVDQASGQSSQTKDNVGTKPVYYNAVAKIEIGVLKDIPKPLNELLTPNRNTVLHIHLTSPIKISEDSKSESSEPAQAEVNIDMKADYLNAYNATLTSEELSNKKIEHAFRYIYPCMDLRRRVGDDIIPKRKDYEAEWKVRKDQFVTFMKETSKDHLVMDTIIATVTFTAGITMPGGFIGQEGPHSGSPVLMRNTTFKAFIITNTFAMLQSCSAAFFHLFMPLLFHEQNLGEYSFLLASLAFFASISAMGAMMLAFVLGTYAVLMHSWGLAIANSVIGLFFFIPVFFVSIGCLNYILEILRVGSTWILDMYKFRNIFRVGSF